MERNRYTAGDARLAMSNIKPAIKNEDIESTIDRIYDLIDKKIAKGQYAIKLCKERYPEDHPNLVLDHRVENYFKKKGFDSYLKSDSNGNLYLIIQWF